MPAHDWTKVAAGMFHDFHYEWLGSIKHALNHGILPEGYYASVDQHAEGYVPDVLTLEGWGKQRRGSASQTRNGPTVLPKPRRRATAEAELEHYRRRKKVVAVRHVSHDEVVAVVEIVSPGNKRGTRALSAFVGKIGGLLSQQIHVVVVDLFPPGRRDPNGIHGAAWDEIGGEDYRLPKRKPLTAVSYEADVRVRAYVEHFAVGDALPNVPLFLEPGGCVEVPLEETYATAFAEVPERWRGKLA